MIPVIKDQCDLCKAKAMVIADWKKFPGLFVCIECWKKEQAVVLIDQRKAQ